MTTFSIEEIKFRPVNVEQDMDFAYHHLFKAGIEEFVAEFNNGEWLESRYEFFKQGFYDPDMKIIQYHDNIIGCFCISNTESAVILQRAYLLSDYQRKGIGQKLIQMALEKSHNQKKPLELEVLINNIPAINSYKKSGFEQISPIITNGWNKKIIMRHKDTAHYVLDQSA
jgi:GNAT superfamily N-acetyltransferase